MVKIFVASSFENKSLANALCTEVTDQAADYGLVVEAVSWHRDADIPGAGILEALKDQCVGNSNRGVSRSDYFAAILTPDDQREKRATWSETPRDNCIFELGLFMGGLGFESRRCFMVCSVEEAALPSDLKGNTYLPFTKVDDPTPPRNRGAMVKPAARIVGQMLSMRKFSPSNLEQIDTTVLMERECPVGTGGDLEDYGEVVVNLTYPMEEKEEGCAAIVTRNLHAKIKYKYFFHNLKQTDYIARLLHRVATADPNNPKRPLTSKDSLEKIHTNLKIMRESWCIYFVPSDGPIEYCIHNSTSYKAKCYLRFPFDNRLVLFAQTDGAEKIYAELVTSIRPDARPLRIFRDSQTFTFGKMGTKEEKEKIEKLWERLKYYFGPEVSEKLLQTVCFGPPNGD